MHSYVTIGTCTQSHVNKGTCTHSHVYNMHYKFFVKIMIFNSFTQISILIYLITIKF